MNSGLNVTPNYRSHGDGTLVKVSPERPEKRGIELATSVLLLITYYSKTSMARPLMVRLPRLFRTHS